MIVKNHGSWPAYLFVARGSGLADSWVPIGSATLLALGLAIADHYSIGRLFNLTSTPFTIMGVAIGIFLGFIITTAYARFWEARTLWGQLINTSRTFARQVLTVIASSNVFPRDMAQEERERLTRFRREMVYKTIAFAHATRHLLRQTDAMPQCAGYFSEDERAFLEKQSNKPLGILHILSEGLLRARHEQWLNDYKIAILDNSLVEFANVLGGCERIKNTPIPITYTILSHRIVAFFCFFLPFGIVGDIGLFTPLVVFLVSHAFFGLDVIGSGIEEPFGIDRHNLPLDAMTRTIEINLLELLGETDVPEPLKPDEKSVLL